MIKPFNKNKKVNHDMLREGLLAEGGGLTADALEMLDKDTAINKSELRRSKSRLSDETVIRGLKEFDKYGPLFQDLTKRTFMDTNYDVISIIITYDSKNCIAICNKQDEHFEL